MLRKIRQFAADVRGQTAVAFGIASIGIAGAAGAAIDYTQMSDMKSAMQQAADAAALASVQEQKLGKRKLTKYARSWFDSNFGANSGKVENLSVRVKRDGDKVRVIAKAKVPTTFLGIVGQRYLKTKVVAEAIMSGSQMPQELVIAIDTTGSMNFNGNWPKAKQSLNDMVDQLKKQKKPGDFVVSLVPFSDRVNVGQQRANRWDSLRGKRNKYGGCLEPRYERIGGNNFALTNTLPSALAFDPTMPGYYGPVNHGKAPTCAKTIVGPTTNPTDIAGGLDSISPSGTGRFDEGMAWAWRMLSPKWKGQWGLKNYPAKVGKKKKSIVFITDGHTYAYEREVYEGGPTQPWGWNNGTTRGFKNFVAVCEMAKDDGVEINAIFLKGNVRFEKYMKACATSPDHYFEIDTYSKFPAALASISETKTTPRLIK